MAESPSRYSLPPEEAKKAPKGKRLSTRKRKDPPNQTMEKETIPGKIR